MIRDERERLVDRLASGHAGAEETKDILARAEADPKLARLLRADRAITVGVAMDQKAIPAGVTEPGIRLATALQASSKGLSGSAGGSLLVKGVVGGLGAIGLAVGIGFVVDTEETAAPPQVNPAVRTLEHMAAPRSSPVAPATTSTDPVARPSSPSAANRSDAKPRSDARPRTRGPALGSVRRAPSQNTARAKSRGGDIDQSGKWRRPGKRTTIQNNRTTAKVKTQ